MGNLYRFVEPVLLFLLRKKGRSYGYELAAELGEHAGVDLSDLDPHRPHVDDVTFACPTCHAVARRVPEVIDSWFDSGAMPFAQWGAPHRNAARFEASFPAQFICEAIDQTRGWFYSLMAVSTLLYGRSSYETVLCLGLILDAEGRKMSKHLGNVVDAESNDPDIQGVRRFTELLAAEPRLSATVLQTVGGKGYDGFALAVVLG